MYDKLWSVIQSGNYQLADITNKINTLWVEGQLTDEERADLLSQAAEHLNPESQRPEVQDMLESLAARVTDLESRVDALEGSPADPDTYPEWQPWDGMSSDYQPGAVVSHNGKLWISTYNGQNIWEPGTTESDQMGLWAEYTPDTGEEN